MFEKHEIPFEILEKLEEFMHELSCYNEVMRYAADGFQDNLSGVFVSFYSSKINETISKIREIFK